MIAMSEPCPICSAKDKEIEWMTAHIARQTKIIDQNREYVQALMYDINLKQKMAEDDHIILDLRQEILTMRTFMTDEQMKELRELLLKAQHKGETK
jgi:hypothetical protein